MTIQSRLPTYALTLSAFAVAALTVTSLFAAGPRIIAEGKLPNDARLAPPKDLNGYFPFKPSASPAKWNRRAARLRREMLVALGLWPMPKATPLRPVIHGRIQRDDYTVEKAYFESFPGFYVTGNLYRPKGEAKEKRPGVLCPHGHWNQGRFYDVGQAGVAKQIEQGAEKFPEGGRSPLQARCVHLARMGCVVFHYDMIGYADSSQISAQVAHRFAKQRPEMNAEKNWGLYSPQAESHLQSVMGLQTYSSIRALDFISSLPDVDAKRLAVTGASGGGTQTFLLAAIDPRPVVAMPAVMVSTAMQGGCTCENCSLLRVKEGNIAFAALFAPRPLGLTAANDWTKELETKGFPELKQLYTMLGAADKVMLAANIEFGHNYNAVGRAAMYKWFNKHLQLGGDVTERDYQRLTKQEMSVWDDKHPQPAADADFERRLLRHWTEDTRRQLVALAPKDQESLDSYRDVVGTSVSAIVGRRLPDTADVEYEQTVKKEVGDYFEIGGLLRNTAQKEELPILFLYPRQWEGTVVIWVDRRGKAGLYQADGEPRKEVRELLARGVCVVGVDLLYQGEFLKDGKPIVETRRVRNPREAAAYTFGYNPSLFAYRVHDILGVITFVRNHELTPERVYLVGLDGAGPWVGCARAQAGDGVDRALVATSGFRFGKIRKIHDVDFLPGGAKYGDLPGMLSLSAPDPLWVSGENKEALAIVRQTYRAAGAEKNLAVYDGPTGKQWSAAREWLLRE